MLAIILQGISAQPSFVTVEVLPLRRNTPPEDLFDSPSQMLLLLPWQYAAPPIRRG